MQLAYRIYTPDGKSQDTVLIVGILAAFGILIALAIAVGPVLAGIAMPAVAVGVFALVIGALLCWMVSATAVGLGLSFRQQLTAVGLSGVLVAVLTMALL